MPNATAPYNFVTLPTKPLASEIRRVNVEDFKAHVGRCGKISGEIFLEIKTLTPIFLGGNSDTKESFSPVGKDKFIIPGSSLRGMFKNIFKIVTCGTFRGRTDSQKKGEDFNDEHIYFRCLMTSGGSPKWTKDLCQTYKSRMEGDKGKNARQGFLIQTFDNEFFIAPLLPNLNRKNDFIMMKDFQSDYRPVKFRDSCVYLDLGKKIAYILTGNQWANKPDKLIDRKSYEEFKESLKGFTDEERAKKIKDAGHGKQIIRFVRFDYVDLCREHWREIPDDVLTSYEHDRNRRGVNLLDKNNKGLLQRTQLKKFLGDSLPDEIKTLIPCHYLEESGQVTAFGHGQCFRIPYRKTIGDAVSANLKKIEMVDFADAVFGREKFWASRVFFEDAIRILNKGTLDEAAAHPLMQPNPTSYQLYLRQDGKTLIHWDSPNVRMRGYKFYWHNESDIWRANDHELEEDEKRRRKNQEPLTKTLKPLQEGTKFISKIRFRNLSAVELGALLMIFNLDGAKSPAYKIGMGKSLGLGSIQIKSTLFVERTDAYTKLFDDGGFTNPYEEKSPDEFIQAFRDYVVSKEMLKTWQEVMDELKKILDWDNKPAPKKIQQMSSNFSDRNNPNPFLQRAVLSTIDEVAK